MTRINSRNPTEGHWGVKRKIITMIGIAAIFGAASIFAADIWLKSAARSHAQPQPVVAAAPKVEFKSIVVAKAPLRFGMTLEPALLEEIPWPQDALPDGAFPTVDALLSEGGRVVLSPVETNEPVLLAKLSGPNGRATLSNILAPGMRAVTIKVDEIAGVGGFITPGDRVDVVLTRNAGNIREVEGNAKGASGSTITTEIVVENVKVLSVGQGADERQTGPRVTDSVTIEVNAEGAQKVALARNVGSMSLLLRSAGESGPAAAGLVTISSFGGSVAKKFSDAAGSMIEKVKAEEPEKQKFTTVIVTRGLEAKSYQVVTPPQE